MENSIEKSNKEKNIEISLTIRSNRWYDVLKSIEQVCKMTGSEFSYSIGYSTGHQAKFVEVWIDGARRTNHKGKLFGKYALSHTKLLDVVKNLFLKKGYDIKFKMGKIKEMEHIILNLNNKPAIAEGNNGFFKNNNHYKNG